MYPTRDPHRSDVLVSSKYGVRAKFWTSDTSKDMSRTCETKKANQKNVRQDSVAPKADVPGHRLYLDLSKVTVKSGLPRMQQSTKTTGRS